MGENENILQHYFSQTHFRSLHFNVYLNFVFLTLPALPVTFYNSAQVDVLDGLGQSREDREGRDGRVREGGHRPPRGGQLAQRSLTGPGDGPTVLGRRQAPSDLQQQP